MSRKSSLKMRQEITSMGILNAIRSGNSQAYADAVPIATGDNLQEVGKSIMNDAEFTNEFLGALINRIGRTIISSKIWNNPLSKFKMGLLEFGEVAQEIFVNQVEERFYSQWDAQDRVFKIALPDVRAIYYEMNSQKQYKATVNESMLKQAFNSQNGIVDLVNGIMNRISLQDQNYEYLTMKNILKANANKGYFYPVKVAPVNTQANAKAFIEEVRAMYSKMQFVSTSYNAMGVETVSEANNIHLFISPEVQAKIDVEVLASAFNMNKTDFVGHLTVIDKMPVANAVAIMVDENWFKVWDNKIMFATTLNNEGLYSNYIFHHWETFASSPFENAVIFTTDDSAITSITFNPTTANVSQGGSVQLKVDIVATGSGMKSVQYHIVSGGDNVEEIVSQGDKCLVRIRANATVGNTIKIRATSLFDTSKTSDATLTVVSV